MKKARRGILAATGAAAAALAVFGAAPAASASPAAASASHITASWSVVHKSVWHTAPSYYPGYGGGTGGYLFAGSSYFYCQNVGFEYTASGYHNNWWLLTDDDSHHSMVWVNAVHVSGGGNDEPIPGVPHC